MGRGEESASLARRVKASGGHAVPPTSHHLSPLAGNPRGDGQGKIPVWLVKRQGCSGYGVIPNKPLPSLTLTDHRPREETFSASHKFLSSPRVSGNAKNIPPALLIFLVLGLLETEINSPTIPRELEKECSGFDHLLEGGKKVEKWAEKCVQC